MEQIIAALIIACSNLTNGGSASAQQMAEFSKNKSECVQRVSLCSERAVQGFSNPEVAILRCAKEVHL